MNNERDLPRTRDTSYASMNAFAPCDRDSIQDSIQDDQSRRNADYSLVFIYRCLTFLHRSAKRILLQGVAHDSDPFLSPGRYAIRETAISMFLRGKFTNDTETMRWKRRPHVRSYASTMRFSRVSSLGMQSSFFDRTFLFYKSFKASFEARTPRMSTSR